MKTLNRSSFFMFIVLAMIYSSLLTAAPTISPSDNEKSGLFDSDEILEMVLTTDIKKLLKNKKSDEYQEGEITLNGQKYPIRLKARGNNRRETCSFPPITLNFSKTNFEDKSFDQLNKLKLVNSCSMQLSYEQYILREYMIYRTFNLLTDKSFRVRLLRIEYVDSNEKVKTVTRYGFVIEDQFKMAERLNGIIIKSTGIKDRSTNRQHMVMLSIFQFMIGNTDWTLATLHNVRLLKINQLTEVTPYVIPYDFDYTGMVDASYALPSPILGIETLRERLFWGKCYSEEELAVAIDYFMQKKPVIYDLYNQFDLFNKSSLKKSIFFLDSFYKIIGDDKAWKQYFVKNCKD